MFKLKAWFQFLFLIISLALPCFALGWSGEVVGITAGDMITVLNTNTLQDVKISLYGIDAPEKGQAFSQEARQFTSKLVYGKVVMVEVMDKDRYGRTVAMIFVDKSLLNEELVKAGLVWVYWQYCHHPICESWKNFQLRAKFDNLGLWAYPDPIEPWKFRRQQRK